MKRIYSAYIVRVLHKPQISIALAARLYYTILIKSQC
jgi:hypothetical protein